MTVPGPSLARWDESIKSGPGGGGRERAVYSCSSVQSRPFDLIAFDGDDTLWHNERSYRDARQRFHALLARAGVAVGTDAINQRINRLELANLEHFGYGVSGFTLSLIETVVELSGHRLAGDDVREVLAIARNMLTQEIELFPGVAETLVALSASYPLMLITKGDLLHQTSKLERSGLRDYFAHVEVVSHKTPDVYRRILARYGVEPGRFLMIGNSLRSDVLPVVEAGGLAVYVPAELTWEHEHADAPDGGHERFFEVPTLTSLTSLVASLEQRRSSAYADSKPAS